MATKQEYIQQWEEHINELERLRFHLPEYAHQDLAKAIVKVKSLVFVAAGQQKLGVEE